MEKYGKVRRRVQNLISELPPENRSLVDCEFHVSPKATVDELTTTHSQEYVQRFMVGDQDEQELRNVGFPWSPEGVDRATSSTGGTLTAARTVLEAATGDASRTCWAAHCAGGTHHAFFDRGEGFCVFSDMAVAANCILKEYPTIVKKILFVDLDVHQGNGNAVLFQDNPSVFTFSVHCSGNFFSQPEVSDLDVSLPPDTNDATYLVTLNHWLKRLRNEGLFDLVFYQAGVDGLKEDRLGRMALTARGLERRNQLVFDFCYEQNLPLVICMGGGYPRTSDWSPIIEAHSNVYFQAHQYLANMSTSETKATAITSSTQTTGQKE